MCSRWASEYRDYRRASVRPVRTTSKPARSLVEVLRDWFRPRRPQVQEAEVVPFPAGAEVRADRQVEREGSRAA